MKRSTFILLGQAVLVLLLVVAIHFILPREPQDGVVATIPETQLTSVAVTLEATSTISATSSQQKITATTTTKKKSATVKKESVKATESPAQTPSDVIQRIERPYSTPPLTLAEVNEKTRAATVNILCTTQGGTVHPISGSGVIVDPRGIILTNAHVAQYVLLSETSNVDLQCYIRTGSPAAVRWIPAVLYIPTVWVTEHASEIQQAHTLGTGEHDYALLAVVASADSSPLPKAFPFVSPDTREAIGFVDDAVLIASYPAEFLGGFTAINSLFSTGSATNIKQLLTFDTSSVDAIYLGGVIEAQSGSSGGAVTNAWGRLIALITTTSEGATTADRNLRAITLGYINRDIQIQTGSDLASILASDPVLRTNDFTSTTAPKLATLLLHYVYGH